jgi:1-acyl-sn-glycerol-3-phosphate acyltransferase
MRFFYRFSTFTVRTIFRLFYGVRLYGLENLDFDGPVIFASNHISLCDPPLIGSFTPLEMHFMAKSELFDSRLLGGLIRALNSFPVKRGMIDRRALEIAGQILNSGGRILVFPEGTRQKSGILTKGRPGMAKIAIDNEAPIIPIHISGSNHLRKLLFSRRHIQIRYGKLIDTRGHEPDLPRKERIRSLGEKVMAEIAALRDLSETRK